MIYFFICVFYLFFAANHCGILSISAFPAGSKPCKENQFPCNNGYCVDKDHWCDMEDDCGDSTDEIYCELLKVADSETSYCPPYFFQCLDDSICIPDAGLCDGHNSCADKSDELDCDNTSSRTPKTTSVSTEFPRFERRMSEPSETTTSDITTTTTATTTKLMTTLPEEDSFLNDQVEKNTESPSEFNVTYRGYTELRSDYYNHQREMAANFLIPQRKDDFRWGDETPRFEDESPRFEHLMSEPSETITSDSTTTATTTTATTTKSMTTLPEYSFLNDEVEKNTENPSKFNITYRGYTELRSEYYNHQREMATNFLISQRKNDFGWGDETPRALMALLWSNASSTYEVPGVYMLMVKQLDVKLSIALARNETKPIPLTDLALYINAIMSTCRNPQNFYGYDLVSNLRHRVDGKHLAYGKLFVSPSVYLTLCINNVTTHLDIEKLRNLSLSNSVHMDKVGIQALALLASTCISKLSIYADPDLQSRLQQRLLHKIRTEGIPKNVYELSLLIQALNAARVNELDWHRSEAVNFLLKRQTSSGSFGDILATYYVLPILSGRSVLSLNEHCTHFNKSDLMPVEVLKNTNLEKIDVKYSLYHGSPVDFSLTMRLHVARGTNFLDIMRLAQEQSPNYKFKVDDRRNHPLVYSIGGIPNDAERGMFWTLYVVSNKTLLPAKKKRLRLYHGSIKMLIPEEDDELVFWMKPI